MELGKRVGKPLHVHLCAAPWDPLVQGQCYIHVRPVVHGAHHPASRSPATGQSGGKAADRQHHSAQGGQQHAALDVGNKLGQGIQPFCQGALPQGSACSSTPTRQGKQKSAGLLQGGDTQAIEAPRSTVHGRRCCMSSTLLSHWGGWLRYHSHKQMMARTLAIRPSACSMLDSTISRRPLVKKYTKNNRGGTYAQVTRGEAAEGG